MNHTPGPWTIDREHFSINHPPQTDNPNECCLIASYGRKRDWAHEANARLIAAAPELLEACRAIALLNEGQGRVNMCEVAGQARAAIAKATGADS